jgi:hypothetical protein
MSRFVMQNTFIKSYIFQFLINILTKIRSQSYGRPYHCLECHVFFSVEGVLGSSSAPCPSLSTSAPHPPPHTGSRRLALAFTLHHRHFCHISRRIRRDASHADELGKRREGMNARYQSYARWNQNTLYILPNMDQIGRPSEGWTDHEFRSCLVSHEKYSPITSDVRTLIRSISMD